MPFSKGQSGNPAGRGKGTPNRITKEVKDTLQAFIDQNTDTLQATFDQLEPRDKMRYFIDLLPYVVPKLANTRIEIPQEIEPLKIVINAGDIPTFPSNTEEEDPI